MNKVERLLLGIITLEIPLQIDAYWGSLQEHDPTYGTIVGINISITTICLFALYFQWLIETATQCEHVSFRWVGSKPLTIYACIAGMSLIVAANQFLAISYLAVLLQAILLFVYVANRVQSRGDIVFMMTMLACSAILQSVAVIACWMWTNQLIGNPISPGSIRFAVTDDGRPCGTLSNPVAAGSLIALLLVPVGSLLLMPVSTRTKLLALGALLAGAVAIPLTQSRGAILAAGLAVAIFGGLTFVRGWLPKWAMLVGMLICVLSAVPIYRAYQDRIVAGDKGSSASRIHLARIAWSLIKDQPFVGVGAGNYYSAVEPYANSPNFRAEWAYTVHCDYLLVWAESGIAGLCAYVAFFLAILHRGWKVWRLCDPFYSIPALAIAAATAGLMLHMFVDLFNSRPHLQMLMCCAAILVAIERLSAPVTVVAPEASRCGILGLKRATA